MDRVDVAYLLNSTPKYFYLLPLHMILLRRYAEGLKWPVYLATEYPDDPICDLLRRTYDVKILELSLEDSGFLESRAAAIRLLPPEIRYVLPMQEDFLLERDVRRSAIEESIEKMDSFTAIASMRWMPCPGPVGPTGPVNGDRCPGPTGPGQWAPITEQDTFRFTFQATLWRREVIQDWFTRLLEQFAVDYPEEMPFKERMALQIRSNYAENTRGQDYFIKWLGHMVHLAWIRAHKAPNAVYLSPWPYRPTAVTNGRLEAWAVELAKREGFPLNAS
jgi:hypothetical protein